MPKLTKLLRFLSVSLLASCVGSALAASTAAQSTLSQSSLSQSALLQSALPQASRAAGAMRPGRVLSAQDRGGVPLSAVNPAVARLYARSGMPGAKYGVARYRLTLASTNEQGQPITVAAQLYLPIMPSGARAPLYVMGPGTTGLANACAPTREQANLDNWGNYEAHMLSYAAQGYVAILPDWANFDEAGKLQPYFVADSEGRVMLDAARAARHFVQERRLGGRALTALSTHTFLAGFSQGGHAAFAAADLAAAYAPELPISGVIGYAPAMDVGTLFRERPALGPYLARSYAARYGLDPARVLQARWLGTLDREAGSMCVTDVYRHYPNAADHIYRPEFLAALRSGNLGRYDPALARLLARNAPGFAPSGRTIPALVVTGLTDPIVTANAQLSFMRKSCAFGRAIVQREYAGANHFQARQYGFRDTLAWMRHLAGDNIAPSSCLEAKYAPVNRATAQSSNAPLQGTPVFAGERR